MIRINPTKIVINGDASVGREYIGAAKSQMNLLINQMSFQNLSQGYREVQVAPGVFVQCRKIFDFQECKILAAAAVAAAGESIVMPEIVISTEASCAVGSDKEYVYIRATSILSTTITSCIIWDPAEDMMAEDIPLDSGGIATFPCDPLTISTWVSSKVDVSSPLFSRVRNGPKALYAQFPSGPTLISKTDTFFGYDEDGSTPLTEYADGLEVDTLISASPYIYSHETFMNSTMDNCRLTGWPEGYILEINNGAFGYTASRVDLTYYSNGYFLHTALGLTGGHGTTTYAYDITSPLGTLFTGTHTITKEWSTEAAATYPFTCSYNSHQYSKHNIVGVYSNSTIVQIHSYREAEKIYEWDTTITDFEGHSWESVLYVPSSFVGYYDPRNTIPTTPTITDNITPMALRCSVGTVAASDPRNASRHPRFEAAVESIASAADQSTASALVPTTFTAQILH